MAKNMGYYNVEDFTRQKKQQEMEIVVPPRANFLAAAKHLRSLFDGKKFTYAFMGSLEMLCLGYRREMLDLQIAYDDRDFNRIKAKLEADQRVRLPEGINSLFPAKILVRTGPAYKDENCTQAGDIEVDLIPPGCYGTPSGGSLARNVVLLSLKVEGKLRTYKGLNMTYLVKTLVQYCRVRNLAWDPRKDIMFLCQEYGEAVSSICSQLDQKRVQQSSCGVFSRISPDEQRKCYQVLLGTEPPPIMAITPPALPPVHKHSASTSDALARSRAASHDASPLVPSQTTSSLLTPSIPGKPIASRRVPSNDAVMAPKISAPSTARESVSTNMNAKKRDSRSRYRKITCPSSRDASPLDAQHPVNIRHSRQQPNGLRRSACHSSQISPNLASIPAAQNSTSIPYLNVWQSVPVLHQPFAQTALLNRPGRLPQQPHNYVSPIEVSTSPVPNNSFQHYMKSQPGSGGGEMPRQHQDSHISIANRPILVLGRDVQQQQQQPQTNQLHAINPDEPVTSQEQSKTTTNASQFRNFPLELDVMSELGHFIAEMSVDRRTPAPLADYESMIPPPLHPHVQPSPAMSTRPLNPQTSSAPLPASLLPGGSTTHDRCTHLSSPPIPSSSSLPNTNTARYTRYYAPPPLTPGSPQPVYKAYQPSSPLLSPLSPPVVQEDVAPNIATPDGESRFPRLGHVDGEKKYVKRMSRSVDSRVLAQDYIASLPCFEHGYGAAIS